MRWRIESAMPWRSDGMAVDVKAPALVAHEERQRVGSTSAYMAMVFGARPLGGVDRRLASGGDERGHVVAGVAVAHVTSSTRTP